MAVWTSSRRGCSVQQSSDASWFFVVEIAKFVVEIWVTFASSSSMVSASYNVALNRSVIAANLLSSSANLRAREPDDFLTPCSSVGAVSNLPLLLSPFFRLNAENADLLNRHLLQKVTWVLRAPLTNSHSVSITM